MTADEIISTLGMNSHPEGGYYSEVYRSSGVIPLSSLPTQYNGDRVYSTFIYFLLKSGQFSGFHRLKSDELWHFYDGCPLRIYMIDSNGSLVEAILGRDLREGMNLHFVIPAGNFFGAYPVHSDTYSLIGCTVAPGFDFSDFELADRADLFNNFPQHRKIIELLTKEV